MSQKNADPATVAGFGDEWSRFDFEGTDPSILDQTFSEYFSLFPWDQLLPGANGFDAGCGTGRWAERVAPRVGHLHCVDASAEALAVARRKLGARSNCSFHNAPVDEMPLADASMDFGFSLGVLHHTPDPAAALRACVSKLKPGAPFLLYLYYSLDNRPWAYRSVWHASNVVRRAVSRLPHSPRYWASQVLAATVYLPLARTASFVERIGFDPELVPLAYYRDKDFYVMRNDALDRFGTRVEHRFSRVQIHDMMQHAGLEKIRFREAPPFWCAIGTRRG